ncbi:MAG: hypothetical protein K8T26_14275 [Lentisphaerae bacterium]|nr:hypothetical protein [Lentisphaerota bacterium]
MSNVHKKLRRGDGAGERRTRPAVAASPAGMVRGADAPPRLPPDAVLEQQRQRDAIARLTEALRVVKAQLAGTEQALREQRAANAALARQVAAQAQAHHVDMAALQARLASAQARLAAPVARSASAVGAGQAVSEGSLLSQAKARKA